MVNLAIFASGSGSNAENIIKYFQNEPQIRVSCICTNKPDAYVIQRAENYHIPVLVFSRTDFYQTDHVLQYLATHKTDWIILAGFLWLLPENLISAYPRKIVNIHPALLPKYGGKGMYGHHVHEAVIENNEPFSGITIHYIDAEYDKGDMIFQARCMVLPDDTPEALAARIHELEYKHFPRVIKEEIMKKIHEG